MRKIIFNLSLSLMLLFTLICGAAAVEKLPRVLWQNTADYSYSWWAYGLKDSRRIINFHTSRYFLSFNTAKLDISHIGAVKEKKTAEEALVLGNSDVLPKGNASLELFFNADGNEYRVVQGTSKLDNIHLIESGRFFERRMINKMRWEEGAPATVNELEIAGWPDRLLLLLRLAPKEKLEESGARITLTIRGKYKIAWNSGGSYCLKGPDGSGFVFMPAGKAVRLEVDAGKKESIISAILAKGMNRAGQEYESGMIIYPGNNPVENLAVTTARQEKTPLKVTAKQLIPIKKEIIVEYNNIYGVYTVPLLNDGKTQQYAKESNDRIEKVRLIFDNPGNAPREVRLDLSKDGKTGVFGVTGLSAMLTDIEGNPLGIPMQISKNWHTATKDRYAGIWYRGLTMFSVPPESKLEIEYVSVNAMWGKAPAASHAQLCMVGRSNNQLCEESAIGSWGESICFEPDQGQNGGAVLDVRPLMVWGNGDAENRKWGWTHNVGGADFLVYYNAEDKKQKHSRMRTLHRRNCPVLTEVTYAGCSYDKKIDLKYTVSIYRTDDITRGVYHFRYDVRDMVTYKRMVFFQAGADNYSYTGEKKFAYGNEDGLIKEWDTQWGGKTYRLRPQPMKGKVPWISMHQAVRREQDKGAWANRGLIIRSWDAKLNGRKVSPWVAEYGIKAKGADTSLADIVPPPGVTTFHEGDYVDCVIEQVIIPQKAGDYYGPDAALKDALEKNADSWQMIEREAKGNDIEVSVATGKLARNRPAMIKASDDKALFSLVGGLGWVPFTISGLKDYRRPLLEVKNSESWEKVDQSVHGKDFWQTDYDAETGTWEITYSVSTGTMEGERAVSTYRFSFEN